ncbi:metallophosphoesterase [Candidatus Omnitrophota bacterium]
MTKGASSPMFSGSILTTIRLKRPLRIMTSVMVLGTFLLYTFSANIAGALVYPADLTRTGFAGTGAPKLIDQFDINSFQLPASLGKINHLYAGSSKNTVIHIQDAHCNKSIQNVIYDLIAHLNGKYGISTINLEGGAGEYDLSFFNEIEDKDTRSRVAEYFLDKGIINGAELYAVNNKDKVKLWGIEDRKLYMNNLNVYRESLKYKPAAIKHLDDLKNATETLKEHLYSKELFELDQKHKEYKEEKLGIVEYLYHLREKGRENGVSLVGYPNLIELYKTKEIEKKIDLKKANKERDVLIDKLREVMSVNETEEMNSILKSFRDEDMTREVFYKYLRSNAREFNIPLDTFPELFEYDAYVESFDNVDATEAKLEISRFEGAIREALYTNDDQRTLDKISTKIDILRDLLDLKLKEDVYTRFLKEKERFGMAQYISFLERNAGKYGIDAGWRKRISELDGYLGRISKFYEYSCKRDKTFLKNIVFEKEGPEATIVITGGFHTERIAQLLEKKNTSYISIIPAYREDNTGENSYYKVLSGGVDPLSETLSSLISNLQIPSILTSMAPHAWGENHINVFRAARDIMNTLLTEGTPVIVVDKDGDKVRFSLDPDQSLRIESNPETPMEDEQIMTVEDILAIYDEKPAPRVQEAPPAEAPAAPAEGIEMIELEPAPAFDLSQLGAQGIERLMQLLTAFIQTEKDDVPSISAIPDLHGKLVRFQDAMQNTPECAQETVFLGDYIDRGKEGLQILGEIAKMKAERPGIATLMGNHELHFMLAMMGNEEAFIRWLEDGGLAVLKEAGYEVDEIEEIRKFARRQHAHGIKTYKAQKQDHYQQLRKAVMNDPTLKSWADWMKQNLDLYHIGRNGVLYMHAGFPMDEFCNITLSYADESGRAYEGLAALAKIEEDMKVALLTGKADAPVIKFLDEGRLKPDGTGREPKERTSPLWVRYVDREGQHSPDLSEVMKGRADKVTKQVGLAMMVVGHTPNMDPVMKIINVGNMNKVFFIDRDFDEDSGVVMYNDLDGWKYRLGSDTENVVMVSSDFEEQRQEARDNAKDMLADIQSKYGTPPAPDLMGKLFDDSGKMVTDIKVIRQENGKFIELLSASNDMPLYDKYGRRVTALPLVERDDISVSILQDITLRDLKAIKNGLIAKQDEAKLLSAIFDGAINVLRNSEIYLLDKNEHGIAGVSDISGEKPVIYLSSHLAEDEEIFTVAAFHEAAEIFLAGRPDLIPEGMDVHTLLRGASKEERIKKPESFRKGLQDEIFGELNDDLTYEITVAQEEFIYDDEARLLIGLLYMYGGTPKSAEEILHSRKPIPRITQAMAKAYLRIVEANHKARAEYERLQQAYILDEDGYHTAFKAVENVFRGKEDFMFRFFRNKDSALNGINSLRMRTLLEQLSRGEREDITVIPSRRNRELLKLIETVKANVFCTYQQGAVADLPEGVEIIVVGDLHTRIDNLWQILSDNNNLAKIRRGKAILLILGDAPHRSKESIHWDDTKDLIAKLKEMETSVQIMRTIQRLKRESPNGVIYLNGNHDYLSGKAGREIARVQIAQGAEFRKELEARFGPEYVQMYEHFLSTNPIMARTPDGFVGVHAAPIKSARSLQEIRELKVMEEDHALVHEAMWSRWKDKQNVLSRYDERDVNRFLKVVDGRILVVAHTLEDIEDNSFYAELMPGVHYVTVACSRGATGYMLFKDGEIRAVDLADKAAQDETALVEAVDRVVKKREQDMPKLGTKSLEERMELLEKRFGKLKVIRAIGSGTFGDVYEVEGEEENRFALKIGGGRVERERGELHRSRRILEVTDIPFAVIMAEESRKPGVDYIPEIIDAGVVEGEPYVATKIVEGHRIINSELLAELKREDIHSIMDQIARIVTILESKGLDVFDNKISNFAYKDGTVILLDTGTCDTNLWRLSQRDIEKLKEFDIEPSGKSITAERALREIEKELVKQLSSIEDKAITREVIWQVMEKARAEETVKLLYAASSEGIRNIRERKKPVVVFLQESKDERTEGDDGGKFGLSRDLERELRKKYNTDNLRVMSYDGTRKGLDEAMGRAESILKDPEAAAVVYARPELHPGKAEGNVLYIKEECPEGDMLSMVGPHVAFALGVVNFSDGNASEDLMRSLEALVKMMVDDKETMKHISEKGMRDFMDKLLMGISMLKMKKIDFSKMRDAIEAQEQLLHSL